MLPAQINPAANTLTDGYVVPAGKVTVISTIIICNVGDTIATARVAIAPQGEADNKKQYIVHGLGIPPDNPFSMTYGIMIAAGDVVRVWADTDDVAFNINGEEAAIV